MSISKKLEVEINNIIQLYNKDRNENYTLNLIKNAILSDNPKHRTISTRYSIIKKMFMNSISNIDNRFLDKIKPDDNITTSIIQLNENTRDNSKLIYIEEDDIYKLLSLANSDNVYELLIFLLFVTGRRISEIYESNFYDIKNTNRIGINGVKKRSDHGNGCEFPILISKPNFFKLMHKFRLLTKNKSLDTVNRNANRYMKNILGDDFHVHNLRGMYANYLFRFRNKDNIKINTFIRDVLCHQSIDASINYTGYLINFNNDIIKNNI